MMASRKVRDIFQKEDRYPKWRKAAELDKQMTQEEKSNMGVSKEGTKHDHRYVVVEFLCINRSKRKNDNNKRISLPLTVGGEIRQEEREEEEKEGARGGEEEGKLDVVDSIVVLILGRGSKGQEGEGETH